MGQKRSQKKLLPTKKKPFDLYLMRLFKVLIFEVKRISNKQSNKTATLTANIDYPLAGIEEENIVCVGVLCWSQKKKSTKMEDKRNKRQGKKINYIWSSKI